MLAERFEQGVAGRRLSPAEGVAEKGVTVEFAETRTPFAARGRLPPAVEKSESELDARQLILSREGRTAA